MGTGSRSISSSWLPRVAVAVALIVGLALIADQARRSSATYDETTYLRVAARWWRGGDRSEIARMGSPLTFWKVQQAPSLWLLDRLGHADWIDDPLAHQAQLLPFVRVGSAWIWAVALGVAATWARWMNGPKAMAMAAWIFALSPNLLAHGTLVTMETPVMAASGATFAAFWWFLRSGDRRAFWASAVCCGMAWSCKFTAVLVPPILGVIWLADLRAGGRRWPSSIGVVGRGMVGFGLAMVVVNLVVTGFATIPLSGNAGPHPWIDARLPSGVARWANWFAGRSYPQDWVAFAVQTSHQSHGGPSYLFGETRMTGWVYYYLVALAVKVPIAVGVLFLLRLCFRGATGWSPNPCETAAAHGLEDQPFLASPRATRSCERIRAGFPILVVVAFVLLASLGSKRNYGIRYLLPVAVPAVVWASGVANAGRRTRAVAWAAVAGMGVSVAMVHPHELSYFNAIAGGPIGGRRILSDSNLDWGQGLRGLAALQDRRPELRDLTFYYFGDNDPKAYGVAGRVYTIDANHVPADLPAGLGGGTAYVAVSASLMWGPWGPPGYFRPFRRVEPAVETDDATILIYRAEALRLEAGRGRGYDGARR